MLDANVVLRALQENRGLQFYATPIDPLSLTLDVFTVESLRAAYVPSLSPKSLEHQVPRYSLKCSWLELVQLREDLQEIVQPSINLQQHCGKCQEMARYLEHCFESPAMFTSTGNGEMTVKTNVAAHFMNALVALVGSLQECVLGAGDDCHRQVVSCISLFLVTAECNVVA
uniref:Uncharacterized protein n=1 Tax=Globisporangium ultimum (strain ATCC 200006 / CBS 805.95 / DAOM BR144) TaxID=431595 RepID=K3X9S1_GLOUD